MNYINELKNNIDTIITHFGFSGFNNEIYLGLVSLCLIIFLLISLNLKKILSLSSLLVTLWIFSIIFSSYIINMLYCSQDMSNFTQIFNDLAPVIGVVLASLIISASILKLVPHSKTTQKHTTPPKESTSNLLYLRYLFTRLEVENNKNIAFLQEHELKKYSHNISALKDIWSALYLPVYFIYLEEIYEDFLQIHLLISQVEKDILHVEDTDSSTAVLDALYTLEPIEEHLSSIQTSLQMQYQSVEKD